jgi:spore maturation protein CgeB
MRWLIVLPFDRPGHMGVDFAEELTALGHDVRTFAYRRENVLYKNTPSKALYQRWIAGRLERAGRSWRPQLTLVIKGGPLGPEVIERFRRRVGTRVINVFPDNPLVMIPFECIEAYDLFFTKERYALGALQQAGLRNLHYLPLYCVPAQHHPVVLTEAECLRYGAALSLVGSRYPYRERFVRQLAGYPLRLWGAGWTRARDPEIRAMVAGGHVGGRDKLCVYSGSTLSLNQHHPLNDIVGVNLRTFELAASGAPQVVDFKDDLATLFKPGEEVIAYRDVAELRRQLDHHLAHPDEARAIGDNARRRALAQHTLKHRIEEILAVVESRLGES